MVDPYIDQGDPSTHSAVPQTDTPPDPPVAVVVVVVVGGGGLVVEVVLEPALPPSGSLPFVLPPDTPVPDWVPKVTMLVSWGLCEVTARPARRLPERLGTVFVDPDTFVHVCPSLEVMAVNVEPARTTSTKEGTVNAFPPALVAN